MDRDACNLVFKGPMDHTRYQEERYQEEQQQLWRQAVMMDPPVLGMVFRLLEPRLLAKARCTCKLWRQVASDLQLGCSRGSSSSRVEAAAAVLCTLAMNDQLNYGEQLFAAAAPAAFGLTQLMNSSCNDVQAAAGIALADLAAGEASRQRITATDGTVHALLQLLNSSSPAVQEAAAAALCNLQQQVDLSNVDEPRLASLRACSGLTLEGFRKWLAARTSGIVLLSGEWLFKQVPAAQQQSYFDALAEQDYLQAAEGAEHLLLMSPHGLQSLQQLLQEEELQAMGQRISSSDAETASTSSPACEGGDIRSSTDQGKQSAFSWALRSIGFNLPNAGGAGQQQGQGAGSTGQGAANTATSAADGSAAPQLPVDACVMLALPASDWWDRGRDESRISDATSEATGEGDTLTVTFKHKQYGCKLDVAVMMSACMKQEGGHTVLGFKLAQILANAEHTSDSSSSSSIASSSKSKGMVLPFMHKVCLSLQAEKQDGSRRLRTINSNENDIVVDFGAIQKDYHYKYKEHTAKVGLEATLIPKGVIGWDIGLKQLPGDAGIAAVTLVAAKTQAQAPVDAAFGSGSSPCTVEIVRQPRHTLLAGATTSLGIINSNAGNKDNDELCYKVKVPADCIDSDGHLLANKLVVRIAVSAFGGVLTTYNTNQVIHSAQEVEVQGNFATSMLDGRVVQLSPLLPLKAPWPGCKLHQRPSK